MKSSLMKFLVIFSAVLFIGTGVSWAGGYRDKGPAHDRGKGQHHQKWHKHNAYPRWHNKRFYRHHRAPKFPYRYRPGYRYHFPNRYFYHGPKHRHHRPGYRGSRYSFGMSIFEPNVAFGFAVKGHK